MTDLSSILERLRNTHPLAAERRRSPRRTGRGCLLLFEVPRFSSDFCWPGRLVDISGSGLAMELPSERLDIDVGAPIYLSMIFRDQIRFDRVAATLVRLEGDVGAVEFGPWPEEERSKLLNLLRGDPAAAPRAGL